VRIWLALALLAGACAPRPSVVGPITVAAASAARVEVDALGRRVVVAAPDGGCIPQSLLSVTEAAAVVVVLDCGAVGRPPVLQTVSVGATRLYDEGGARAGLDRVEAFLRSPRGLRELGMGGSPEKVLVRDMRRADGALFMLVDDSASPFASHRFWRVVAEVNGRVALVTVASLDAESVDDADLLGRAQKLMAALRDANGALTDTPSAPRPRPGRRVG
jgi:hypothetical protein